MSYEDLIDEACIRSACKAVNWQVLDDPSNQAMRVSREIKEVFEQSVMIAVNADLASLAEVIARQDRLLKGHEVQIGQAWEALKLDGQERDDAECVSAEIDLLQGRLESTLKELEKCRQEIEERRQESIGMGPSMEDT
ncbi:MAG: hypothetical protein V3T64_16180 [Myxococcota bacterium]